MEVEVWPTATRTMRPGALDEFTVPEEAQFMVTEQRPHIEQLFGVELNILGVLGTKQNAEDTTPGARKIWLQLKGSKESLQRAKVTERACRITSSFPLQPVNQIHTDPSNHPTPYMHILPFI